MTDQLLIEINHTPFPFKEGETILEVARRNGIDIPTLCHLKGAVPTGECRICVVEVKGARSLLASCATPAQDGMVVLTESPKVVEARKSIIALMLASGNHNCAIGCLSGAKFTSFQLSVQENDRSSELCPAWGDCRLQDLAYRYQVVTPSYDRPVVRYPTEHANPFIIRDFSRCILCGRCVQACNDIQVNNAISFGYRGASTKIVVAGDRTLKDSDCVFCGECVQACPVGALVEKNSRYIARPWEVRKIKTTCSYCGVGCQMLLHVKDNRVVKITGDENSAPNYGSLCVKGRFGFDFIHSPERLTTPLIKKDDGFHEVSWDEALGLIAEKFTQIQNKHRSDALGVLASARITNEENYLVQKFARAVLKTPHVDHCARLCHASTVAGLAASFGSGAMTNPMSDVLDADVVLITGSNPTENHPVFSTFLKRAVQSGRTRVILVDPRCIDMARFADVWLRQKVGTDVCWINGMMNVIIAEKLYDNEFIEKRTVDFEKVRDTVKKYTPQFVESITGIASDELIRAARMYATASAASIVYCMGITQHTTGTDNVKSLANLAMLCGHMGKKGGGVNPLRGQNNVQGACDMGALPNVFSGYQSVTDSHAVKIMETAWNVAEIPSRIGDTVTAMLPRVYEGSLKGLYIVGENPMLSDPDLNHTEKCLKNLDFMVVQDIFMTETAKLAHVVLPSACFAEKDGTFTNTERRVQRIRQAVTPSGEAKTDWEIICDLATRMGYPMAYEKAEEIFDEMAAITPSYKGITYGRLEKDEIHWPCPSLDHPGTPILHTEQFTCGKGNFHAVEYVAPAEIPDKDYPLYLTTGRILYHYHTGTMTMKSDDLNEIAPECFVEISLEDAQAYGVTSHSRLCVTSRRGQITAMAKISDKVPPGTLFIPFHYAGAAANRLTNAALDPICKIPELKVCAVNISSEG